jgi:hypothetical protein
MRLPVLLLTLLIASVPVSAESLSSLFRDEEDGKFDASRYLAENAFGFLPVPIIITDPAVDGGLGVTGLFFHESEEQAELRREALKDPSSGSASLLTPSLSAVAAGYTGNDSWFVGGRHIGFFRDGSIRYIGGGGYGDVNLDFFGFGEIDFEKPVELNTEALTIIQTIKFKLGQLPLFAGFSQRYIDAAIRPGNLGDLSGELLPPEYQEEWDALVRQQLTQDVSTSALGVIFEFDSRDNFFSPHAGYRYELEHLWYRDAFGSDIEYELLRFKALNYWKPAERWRMALRVDYQSASTDALLPPFATPAIELRGIQAQRYQGNSVAVAEGEVTLQVNPRWSFNAFVGGGRAANESGELSDSSTRVTKGGGFRYLIARRYGFEMGIDIAQGPNQTIFYIQAGTAW